MREMAAHRPIRQTGPSLRIAMLPGLDRVEAGSTVGTRHVVRAQGDSRIGRARTE